MLEGEVKATFRGKQVVVRAGDTMNIPSNAPHRFQNVSGAPARILCVCAPAGLDEFFLQVGTPVATRTTPPPVMSEAEQMAVIAKFKGLASKYGMELLREA